MYMMFVLQSEEIFLDMFEDEYREMTVSYVVVCVVYFSRNAWHSSPTLWLYAAC